MSWKIADFTAELQNMQMLLQVRKSNVMGGSLVGQMKEKLACHPWNDGGLKCFISVRGTPGSLAAETGSNSQWHSAI